MMSKSDVKLQHLLGEDVLSCADDRHEQPDLSAAELEMGDDEEGKE